MTRLFVLALTLIVSYSSAQQPSKLKIPINKSSVINQTTTKTVNPSLASKVSNKVTTYENKWIVTKQYNIRTLIDFEKDSMRLVELKSKIQSEKLEIQQILIEKGINKQKDPFETTLEYQNKINQNEKLKSSLIESKLAPIEKEVNLLRKNIYQKSINKDIRLIFSSDKYNADKGTWEVKIVNNNITNIIILNILPAEAKLLWQAREEIQVYNLRTIENSFIDAYGINLNETTQMNFIISNSIQVINNLSLFTKDNKENYESKRPDIKNLDDLGDKVYQKVEIDAEFPGGTSGWTRYVTREIERNIDDLQDDGRSGTAVVLFIVDKEGQVSEVRALTCIEAGIDNCLPPNSKLAEIAVNAIRKGPKWKPAIQNGRVVKAYRRQPVTFRLAEN